MKTTSPNPSLLRKTLLAWYRKNKRDLPWRRTDDPYRILVSEIMLQQTQVDTVIPYYHRFLLTFPTLTKLAKAPEKKVLKLWEGLGYYSRARNLHRAVKEIQLKFKGKVPETLEELESLPGIGRYTAGAVASIAFGLRAPILDGNVKRVLCRLFAIEEDPSKTKVKNQLWELAGTLVPVKSPGDFNQSLMEFGATICTPRNPLCGVCPLKLTCNALALNIQLDLPRISSAKPIPKIRMRVAVIKSGKGLLMGPRPNDGLLAGMWAFPEFEWKKLPKEKNLRKKIERTLKLKINPGHPLEPVVHVYSHRRITYYPRLFLSPGGVPPEPWTWIPMGKIRDYPLPGAMKKILLKIRNRSEIPLAAEKISRYPSD